MVTTQSMEHSQASDSQGSPSHDPGRDGSAYQVPPQKYSIGQWLRNLDAAYERRKALLEPSTPSAVQTPSAVPDTFQYQDAVPTKDSSAIRVRESLDVPETVFGGHANAWDADLSRTDVAAEEDILMSLDAKCRDSMVRVTELQPMSLPEWEGHLSNFVVDNPELDNHMRTTRNASIAQPSSSDCQRDMNLDKHKLPSIRWADPILDSVYHPLAHTGPDNDWDPCSTLDPEDPFIFGDMMNDLSGGSETQEPVFTFPDDP